MRPGAQEDIQELEAIKDFKRGYVYFLSSFQSLIASFIQYLAAGTISEQNKRDLLPFRKALDQELNNSQKRMKDIIFNLDEKHMYPMVKKEYSRYFQGGYVDGPRTDYVQFHLIFEMLRTFTMDSKLSWAEIKKSITEGKFNDQVFKEDSLLNFRINAALEKLEVIRIFLKRMAFILAIENIHQILDVRSTKPKFRENIQYKLSAIFNENLYDTSVNTTEENHGPIPGVTIDEHVKMLEPPKRTVKTEDKSSTKDEKKLTDGSANFIQAYGRYSWNSDQHYLFRYETEKYLTEKAFFKQTISMEIHLGADEQVLRSELIKSMSSIKRKLKSAEEYEIEYLTFLNNFFDFIENIIIMNLGIPNQLKWVFLFHIGPSHFYMIAKKFLMEVNTGFLHVQSLDGKKVTRVIPGEVVKKHVIDYWNKVILPNVGDEKNNLALLKRIADVVSEKYKEASARATAEYDKLPDHIKASKRIDELFRENMNHWMGAANIIVFKRFVKNKSL
jgi:hypothetical protein